MLLLKCCFTSTETVGLLGTGAQDGHLDFHEGGLGVVGGVEGGVEIGMVLEWGGVGIDGLVLVGVVVVIGVVLGWGLGWDWRGVGGDGGR